MTTFELSASMLRSAGFKNLTAEQTNDALRELYETLEIRLGRRLAAKLTEPQLAEFERLVDRGDEKGQSDWLQRLVSDYREQTRDEIDYIIARLTSAAAAQTQRKIELDGHIDR